VRRSVGVALVVVTALALLAGALSRREPVRRVATPTVKVKGKSADPASSPGTAAWESVDRILDDGTWARFGTFEGNQAIIAEIDEAAQRLTAGGARLVIVTLPPPPPDAPDKHEAAVNLPLLNTLLRGYAHDHPDKVFVAEMAELLCSTDTCPSNVDGMVPRPDGVHFDDTHSGRWVADQLIPMLLAPVIPADPGTRETRAPATPG
jgi:hypothetical protein